MSQAKIRGILPHIGDSESVLALGVVGLLIIMVIPLPPLLLDLLLSFSITMAVVILLVALYTKNPLDFSVFPSILLLATLLRLGLNVASTRLILLNGDRGGDAVGKVIESFGNFVVGGNFIVGLVVFCILVIINFIVITKGAGRIAEVAARFTLDALPGKQMAIDADLNAGLINENQARERRRDVAREADFYGAMDGASKFVRGDAVAGIIITLVNIFGGLAIGVGQKGLTLAHAAENYTLLTIGDGLVAQIPALVISTAAGIVVTRAGADRQLGQDISRQLLVQPKVLGMSGAILGFLGLVPGLPHVAFLTFGTGLGLIAMKLRKAEAEAQQTAAATEVERQANLPPAPEPDTLDQILSLDLMELEVGYGLIPLVDGAGGGDLVGRIKAIRKQCATELGIVVPPIHIRDNLQLRPNEYAILIKGNEVARWQVSPGHYLAMSPGGDAARLPGAATREPAFGLPAVWIDEAHRDQAQLTNHTVVDVPTVVATHITEVIRGHAYELVGRQETKGMLDRLAQSYPKVVEELVPDVLSVGQVAGVLQRLLRERVPIRDLRSILESLADAAGQTRDLDLLTEHVRQGLARSITRQHVGSDGTLALITLSPRLEEKVQGALQQTAQGSYLAMDPDDAQRIVSRLSDSVGRAVGKGYSPVLMAPPLTRGHLKRLTERFIPNLTVLSPNEIAPGVQVRAIETVEGV
ncbi:MAG: flagellar biosynthesis protein FlhA [Nitrospirae bacterium]|nr:flagellar biosynthesis protein FlhA [Nitrospirota bacterium]